MTETVEDDDVLPTLPSSISQLEHRLTGIGDLIDVCVPIPLGASFVMNEGNPLHRYCAFDLALSVTMNQADDEFLRIWLHGSIPYVEAAVNAIKSSVASIMDLREPQRPNLVEFDIYPESAGPLIGRQGSNIIHIKNRTGANIDISTPEGGSLGKVSVWGSVSSVAAALHKIHRQLLSAGRPFLPVPKPVTPESQLTDECVWYLEIPAAVSLAQRVIAEVEDSTGAKLSLGEAVEGKRLVKLVGLPVPLHYAIAAVHAHLGPGIAEERGYPDFAGTLPSTDLPPHHAEWADVYLSTR